MFCNGGYLKKEVLSKECLRRGGEGAILWEGGRGYYDAISGLIDGQNFHIHGVKDPDYTIMITTPYDTLERGGDERKRCSNRKPVWSKNPDIFCNHYTYWHYVDDNNNHRKSPISIEKTWATSFRSIHVF